MLQPSDLIRANDKQLELLISQAEVRLNAQAGFATAADSRAASIASVSAALAGLAVGVVVQSLRSAEGGGYILAEALAVIGFSSAAGLALRAWHKTEFHPVGYRPCDFLIDIKNGSALSDIKREMAADLNDRLEFNSTMLSKRANLLDQALIVLALTPPIALITALGVAVAGFF